MRTLPSVSVFGLVAMPDMYERPNGKAGDRPDTPANGLARYPAEKRQSLGGLVAAAGFGFALISITVIYGSLPTSRAVGHAITPGPDPLQHGSQPAFPDLVPQKHQSSGRGAARPPATGKTPSVCHKYPGGEPGARCGRS
jgi:hypothetical protein